MKTSKDKDLTIQKFVNSGVELLFAQVFLVNSIVWLLVLTKNLANNSIICKLNAFLWAEALRVVLTLNEIDFFKI